MTRGVSNTWTSTLSVAYTAGSGMLVVVSSSGCPVIPFGVKIDSEHFTVVNVAGTRLSVVGGQEGSTPAAHRKGSAVRNLLTALDVQQLQLATQRAAQLSLVRSPAQRAFIAQNYT